MIPRPTRHHPRLPASGSRGTDHRPGAPHATADATSDAPGPGSGSVRHLVRRGLRRAVALAVPLALLTAVSATGHSTHNNGSGGRSWSQAADAGDWTTTWAAPMDHVKDLTTADKAPSKLSITGGGQTLRMPVHASIGGSRARIRLDNTGNGTAIRIGHATLAHQKTASAAAEHPVSLTFGGRQDVTIAAGGELASDPLDFTVTADEVLLVSIYLPDPVTTVPYHSYTLTTLYSTPKTDHTDRSESIAADTENSPDNLFRRTQDDKYGPRVLVSGVEVTPAAGSRGTVVAIGDSQTDGGYTDLDGNHRWLDGYGRALQASSHPRGVANAGISANQVLKDGSGASMLHRFRHDVLDVPGVKEVIFYGGINDITLSDATATALEKAVTTLAGQAHEAGLTFTAVTLPPFHGYQRFTSSPETTRRQFNAFLRTTQAVDRVVDFDQTSYDPATPAAHPADATAPPPAGQDRLYAGYYDRTDDRLHLNDNGNWALAQVLTPSPAPRPRPASRRPTSPTPTTTSSRN